MKIPDSVIKIDDEAFAYYNSYSIKKIILSKKLQTIGDRAFMHAQEVREIELPDTLISIGDDAFANVELIKLAIPASVKYIGESAFVANSLTEVTYYGTSPDQITFKKPVFSTQKPLTLILPNAENINDPAWKTFLGGNFDNIRKQ